MTESDRDHRVLVLGLVLAGLIVRLVAMRGNLWRLSEDVDNYLSLAQNVAEWRTFGKYDMPTAYRPPLYPMLLAPLYWLESTLGLAWGWRVTAIALLHLCFAAVAIGLTFRLARIWGLGRWSILAGALVALDPLLVHHTRLPMTESLAALILVAGLVLVSSSDRQVESPRTYAAGVVVGLGMLSRTTFWSFAILAACVGGLVRGDGGRRPWKWAATLLTVALVVQVPWVVRNWRTLGRPVMTTTHGGYTLLLGNNQVFYDEVIDQTWGIWNRESLERWQNEVRVRSALEGARTEAQYDAYCYRVAWRTIRSRPKSFLMSVTYRIMSFWRVMPHATDDYSRVIRSGCAVFYAPELLLAIVGLTDRRVWHWPMILLPVTLASFTLVHALYWSDMRMRAPIMPAVAVLAALGAARLITWARGGIGER